jgi:hypothetical protein
MDSARTQMLLCCWECERRTVRHMTVTLRTVERPIGRLSLCPQCYHDCYLPLRSDTAGGLTLEVGSGGQAPAPG